MKNIAIITAGGCGSRLKSDRKKQFMEIMDRPILFWTIDKFVNIPDIDRLIITLPPDAIAQYRIAIKKEFTNSNIKIVKGGKSRKSSVYNGLISCPQNTDYVLIHDGVRPFIAEKDIKRLLRKAVKEKAVIPVSHIKNTIKEIAKKKITKTVPRENLYNALTPQIFEYNTIFNLTKKILNKDIHFTDDASILEYFKFPVSTLECDPINFKITDRSDLKIAKLIIKDKFQEK